MRLLDENFLLATTPPTITASSTASGSDPENVLDYTRRNRWTSATSNVTQNLIIDLGSARAATCAALADYNIMTGGDLKLYEGGSGGAPGAYNLVATCSAANENSVGIVFFGSTSARHWKIEWTEASTGVFAECGYAFLGTYIEARNPVWPGLEEIDPSLEKVTIDGYKTFVNRAQFTSASFLLPNLTEAQMQDLRDLNLSHGVAVPFFLSLDTSTTWMAWLVRMTSFVREVQRAQARIYNVTFSWEEARVPGAKADLRVL